MLFPRIPAPHGGKVAADAAVYVNWLATIRASGDQLMPAFMAVAPVHLAPNDWVGPIIPWYVTRPGRILGIYGNIIWDRI